MFGTFLVSAIFLLCTAAVGLYLVKYLFGNLFGSSSVFRGATKEPNLKEKKKKEPVIEDLKGNMMKDIIPKSNSKNSKNNIRTRGAIISQYESLDYSEFDSPTFCNKKRMDRITSSRSERSILKDMKEQLNPSTSKDENLFQDNFETEDVFNNLSQPV